MKNRLVRLLFHTQKKNRRAAIIFLMLMVCVSNSSVFCQSENQIVKRSYTMEQGLSSNRVYGIVQDSLGFVWVGTNDGLNRFDGFIFKKYRFENNHPGSISSNSIRDLLISSNQKMWVALDNGVDIYDPFTGAFEQFRLKTKSGDSIRGRTVSIVEDRDKDIWIGTESHGLFRYIPGKEELIQYRHNESDTGSISQNRIRTICADREGRIWVATYSEGVNCFSKKENTFTRFKKSGADGSLSDNSVQKIFEDSYGYLWFGTFQHGIDRFDKLDSSFKNIPSVGSGNLLYHIQDISELQPGKIIVSSDKGVGIYNNIEGILAYSNSYNAAYLPSTNKFIYKVFNDREGGLWLGSYYGGLEYVPPMQKNFPQYSCQTSDGLGNVVNTILEAGDGKFWIGTDDNGLHFFDSRTNRVTPFRTAKDIHSSYYCIHDLLLDNDLLFAATYERGIEVFNLKTGAIKSYLHDPANDLTIPSSRVFSLFKSSNGRIYAGTSNGLCYYNREKDDFVRMPLNYMVIAMEEDLENNLWVATKNNGLYKYDLQRNIFRRYVFDANDSHSLIRNNLTSLAKDVKGNIWIGSDGYGLCRYDNENDNFVRYDNLQLPNKIISAIVPDGSFLWLATNQGLVRWDKNSKETKVYSKASGLFNEQFSPAASCISSSGKIFLGNAMGFCFFSPNRLTENTYKAPVVITSLLINGKQITPYSNQSALKNPIELTKSLSLNHDESTITFEFASLSYIDPTQNKYRYKLDGFESEWREASGYSRSVTYMNLPRGNYTLRIQGTNSDQVWNLAGTSLRVKVKPHFLVSTPAIVVYVILFFGAIALLINYLLRSSEKKHQEKLRLIEIETQKAIDNSKLEFFTNIAHEIRTPLSLIIGPVEYIAQSPLVKERFGEYLSIIELNYKRLYSLITQLLDFRKVDSGNYYVSPAFINLGRLVEEMAALFKVFASQKNLDLQFCMNSDSIYVYSDKEALSKILSNLISNAMKFANSQVKITLTQNEEWARISVEDDGPGIPQNERENIFKAFYQVKEKDRLFNTGIGVGLNMTRDLTKLLGGSIESVDRENGFSGSCFVVNIPVGKEPFDTEREEELKAEKINSVSNATQLNGKSVHLPVEDAGDSSAKPTVLLVDDSPDVLDFLTKILHNDYRIYTSENGEEALDVLQSVQVDLVVSDVMMEKMDGLELCRRIKEKIEISHVPIVLLTAKTDLETKLTGLEHGIDAYVEKPFSPFQLKAQLKNLLDKREELRIKYATSPDSDIAIPTHNKLDQEFVDRCLAIINENISETDFSIDVLAREMAMSRTSLFTKVKAITGMTPNDFIKVTRLKAASKLLAEGRYRITEIGYLVGFSSPSYFAKCFSKQFGMLPTEYVRNV